MYPSLQFVVEIDGARRREAERQAAQWRLVHLLAPHSAASELRPNPWRQIALLARACDRRTMRSRLKEYVAR